MVATSITREPIDPAAALAAVGEDADGAVLLFLGTVRDHNEGRAVRGMRYDAYESMAAKELGDIVAEVAGRFGVSRIMAVHRVGDLSVGEVSVAVAVSSPHRAEAYGASRGIMEEIKRRLPVWKEEHYVDGAARWLDGQSPARSARPPGSAPVGGEGGT